MKKLKNVIKFAIYFIFIINLMTTQVQATGECDGIFTVEAMDFIEEMIGYVRIFVPILLIILGAVDFGSAVLSQEQDALKKSGSKFVKRCIAAVAIFFVPTLIKLILSLPGIKDNIILVDDPTCGL